MLVLLILKPKIIFVWEICLSLIDGEGRLQILGFLSEPSRTLLKLPHPVYQYPETR